MITEERVTNLEATLVRFIDQTSIIVAEIHEDIAESRASNARTDRQLLQMQQQADKAHQEWSRRFDERNEQIDKKHAEWSKRLDEQNERYEKERKESNKRWAEISDSMGTLIEDMVAPCGFQLARAIFATEEAETSAIRIKRKNPAKPGHTMELDLLVTGATKVLVVEAKRRTDAAKVTEYRDKLGLLPEFFPELAGKTVYAAVASVYLDTSVIAFLNREKVYGIAMGDEVMQVVNLRAF